MGSKCSHFDFSGKVVLVTGSTRGIGHVTAQVFAKHGATVVINGRTQETTKQAAGAIKNKTQGDVMGFSADIGNVSEVQTLFKQLDETCGGPDILINNAAMRPFANIEHIGADEWDSVIRANLSGTFFTTQEAVKRMRHRKSGVVVSIASIAATATPSYYNGLHYIASKGGVISFTRGLAKEVGSEGIRANSIVLGIIKAPNKSNEKACKYAIKNSFLKRPGLASEVAQTCLFLASDMSSLITGEAITLGGY